MAKKLSRSQTRVLQYLYAQNGEPVYARQLCGSFSATSVLSLQIRGLIEPSNFTKSDAYVLTEDGLEAIRSANLGTKES